MHTYSVKQSTMLLLYTVGKKCKRYGTCSGCISEDCRLCKFVTITPGMAVLAEKKQCCVRRQCTQLQKNTSLSSGVPQEKNVKIVQLKQHMAHIVLPPQSTLNLQDDTITSPPPPQYRRVQQCNVLLTTAGLNN